MEDTDDVEDASGSIEDQRLHLDVSQESCEPHRLLFGNTSPGDATFNVSPALKERLLNVYQERVDCLFKPLHWPSTLAAIQQQGSKYQSKAEEAEHHALEYALYFTSACTLFDHELDRRQSVVEALRQECERALVRAGLLTTTSCRLLQALIVYLVSPVIPSRFVRADAEQAGIRACRSNAQQWTLTAIAVRLANAQGIPSSLATEDSSVNMQVRRRLWQCIGVLDLQSAFDRGSQPLIGSHDLFSLPINTNDHELNPQSAPSATRASQHCWTDMTLSMITYQAGRCQRRLTELGISVGSNPHDRIAAHREQLDTLAGFEMHVNQLTIACGTSPSDVQKFALAVALESLVAMRLLVRRPLHRRGAGLAPLDDDFNVLKAATEVLERSQMKRTQSEFAPWAWFQWVKWYALAVVLAELCGTPQGPLAARAWTVAQLSFEDYAKDVADTKSGLLWTPIKRLMRRAQQIRRSEAPSVPSTMTSATNEHFFGTEDVPMDTNGEQAQFDHSQEHLATKPRLSNPCSGGDENNTFVDEGKTSSDSWIHWDLLLSDLDNPLPSDWWIDPPYDVPTT